MQVLDGAVPLSPFIYLLYIHINQYTLILGTECITFLHFTSKKQISYIRKSFVAKKTLYLYQAKK